MVPTILTKNPQKGQHGQEISKQKYDTVRAAIMEVLAVTFPLTPKELTKSVVLRLQKTPFPGDIAWYTNVVMLDLEARKYLQAEENPKTQVKFYKVWPELPL